MKYHSCPLCADEALPERCPDFQFDYVYADVSVDLVMHTRPDPIRAAIVAAYDTIVVATALCAV